MLTPKKSSNNNNNNPMFNNFDQDFKLNDDYLAATDTDNDYDIDDVITSSDAQTPSFNLLDIKDDDNDNDDIKEEEEDEDIILTEDDISEKSILKEYGYTKVRLITTTLQGILTNFFRIIHITTYI